MTRSRPLRSIAIVTPHVAPERNAAANRCSALVAALVEAGWDVAVITVAPNHPEHRVHEGYGRRWREVSHEAGVLHVRFRPWLLQRGSLVARLIAEARFALLAGAEVVRMRRPVLLASSPYMFLGPATLLAARWLRARFAWDVRDLTWEYVAATGRRTFGLDRALGALMAATAARADLLTTATFGQVDRFARRPARTLTIVNGLDDEALAALAQIGAQGGFGPGSSPEARPVVLYAGLLGLPQGLEVMLDAAELMPIVDFVLAGDGPDRTRLEARANARGLLNVRFTGHLPFTELVSAYESATILVAHLRRHRAFALAQPSKLWEYMAAGRPVVYAGEGEAAAILDEHRIGAVCAPDDATALVATLLRLLDDPAERAALVARARAFVARERRRSEIARRWVGALDDLVDPPSVGAAPADHSVDRPR